MNKWKTRAVANLIGTDTAWKLLGDKLIIYTEGVFAPSEEAINAEIARLEAASAQAEAEAKAKRSAALAKLEALGLDEDDLKALGL